MRVTPRRTIRDQRTTCDGRAADQLIIWSSVAALILAVLVAPVGLVLGVIAMVQARKQGRTSNGLALSAVIVGGVLTALGIAGIVITATILGSFANEAQRLSFCTAVDSYRTDLSTVAAYESDDDPEQVAAAINSLFSSAAADQLLVVAFNDQMEDALLSFNEDLEGLQGTLYPNDKGLRTSYLGGSASDAAREVLAVCSG